jgi:hypothetical protein
MNKKNFIAALLLAMTTVFVGANAMAVDCPYLHDFCPTGGGVHGWWATFTPTHRLCSTDYYTWNSTSYGSEESWYLSGAIYQLCGQQIPNLGGPSSYDNVLARAYIPWAHATQTHYAHYYDWESGSTYYSIGSINQYGTAGWGYLATTNWVWIGQFKLSDWTNESYETKTVDLDSYSVDCPT